MAIDQYLTQQYILYLGKLPSELWASYYKDFCIQTSALAGCVRGNSRRELQNACNEAGVQFDQYLSEVWYERHNRVASLRQGGISIDTFNAMMAISGGSSAQRCNWPTGISDDDVDFSCLRAVATVDGSIRS